MHLLHDEQCKIGGVASQLELHLQQTRPLFGPKPYKHPKITKLNRNTHRVLLLFLLLQKRRRRRLSSLLCCN
jgi:hypothetical protein